ncbi:MAG TPA: hypothetical protein VK747_03615 [Blastocatellia bacterium]|nr:hypothetical protein [Blastocatellia bacterium]
MGKEKVISLRVKNTRTSQLVFCLEPWGEQHTMDPGVVFHVTARGPDEDFLEIECGDSHITLFGWTGSVVAVFQDGVELGTGPFEKETEPPLSRDE